MTDIAIMKADIATKPAKRRTATIATFAFPLSTATSTSTAKMTIIPDHQNMVSAGKAARMKFNALSASGLFRGLMVLPCQIRNVAARAMTPMTTAPTWSEVH